MPDEPHLNSADSDTKPAPAEEVAPRAGDSPPPPSAPAGPDSVDRLTPEEQMERFERELKETDWGHQPC